MSGHGRLAQLGVALDAVEWAMTQRAPWTYDDFTAGMEISRRTAYRWIGALETRGLVERCGHREHTNKRGVGPTLWRWTGKWRVAA